MVKLLGVLLAFVLCTGVWLGSIGAAGIFLWLFGWYDHPAWGWIWTFLAIGLISILLIRYLENHYPYTRPRI